MSDILTDNIINRVPTLLFGPPSCGKTARVQAAAAACGHRCVVWRLSLLERPDIGGALIPDLSAGITRCLPLDVLHDLQTTLVPTVLLLDDAGLAPPEVQGSAYRLFDKGVLSPHVCIFAATNRPQDKAGCLPIGSAFGSRFLEKYTIATPGQEESTGRVLLCPYSEELDRWVAWAWNQPGIAPEIVAYHRSTQGSKLYRFDPATPADSAWAGYRQWEHVIRLFARGVRTRARIAASIGVPDAAEFLTFCELAGTVPTPEEVWLDPQKCPVPESPGAQYMISAILSRAVRPEYAAQFCTYIDRLNRVMAAFAARDAFRQIGEPLTRSKEWTAWFAKNKDLFQS